MLGLKILLYRLQRAADYTDLRTITTVQRKEKWQTSKCFSTCSTDLYLLVSNNDMYPLITNSPADNDGLVHCPNRDIFNFSI